MNSYTSPSIIELNPLTKDVVDCAFKVHKHFGPGLLESIYHEAFAVELKERDIPFELKKLFSLLYKNKKLKNSFKIDILIDDNIIVELKAVERLQPIHDAQILSYLKLTNKKLGVLINFNTPLIKDGIKRIAL